MSKDKSILHFNSERTLLFLSQLFNLLLLLVSQNIKDLNHPLRGIFNGDVSSHIILLLGSLQIYNIYFDITNLDEIESYVP